MMPFQPSNYGTGLTKLGQHQLQSSWSRAHNVGTHLGFALSQSLCQDRWKMRQPSSPAEKFPAFNRQDERRNYGFVMEPTC